VHKRRRRLPFGDGQRKLALGCDRTRPAPAPTAERRTLLGATHRAQVFARSRQRRSICVVWPYTARMTFCYLLNVSVARAVRLAESFPLAPFRFLRLVFFPSSRALTPCVSHSGSARTTAARRVASPLCSTPQAHCQPDRSLTSPTLRAARWVRSTGTRSTSGMRALASRVMGAPVRD
jgi:hypothetical protein